MDCETRKDRGNPCSRLRQLRKQSLSGWCLIPTGCRREGLGWTSRSLGIPRGCHSIFRDTEVAGWDRGLGVTPLILLELPPHYPFITQQSKQHFNWQPSDTEVREKKAQHIVSIMWSSSGRSGLSPLSDQPPQSNGS